MNESINICMRQLREMGERFCQQWTHLGYMDGETYYKHFVDEKISAESVEKVRSLIIAFDEAISLEEVSKLKAGLGMTYAELGDIQKKVVAFATRGSLYEKPNALVIASENRKEFGFTHRAKKEQEEVFDILKVLSGPTELLAQEREMAAVNNWIKKVRERDNLLMQSIRRVNDNPDNPRPLKM